ncbi:MULTISPECIES: PPK2 family polyphosphate kinase [unclassified Arthrobacter]|uniref:PPK2 family polyphosphate kinase n=1 Tax=unclassified Arthrobacter TaxID=235627 RepID=UPI001491A0B7|nr:MULTISPECIES: PPK2 family polyphosphate kinase [unclassified Arthrobacter]MBE0008886.1 polyphosphate kinase 2 family protein [Arthrobacter sp. AET 35A]NOJ62634.1 polyphosphate kinase 2 family protein [Arthrobacter sp. 147(2020)]
MPSAPAFKTSPTQGLLAGPDVDLASIRPRSTPGFSGGKKKGKAKLAEGNAQLSDLQEKLFAESRFGSEISLLVVLQAMDTAGKGGIVRHVVGAVDPQGVKHYAFKAPTRAEKRHDFLWRVRKQLPGPGIIGVFDRSHYEDVLIQRVRGIAEPATIEERYGIIRDFEAGLTESGTRIIKVMLHISPEEQKERLTERLKRKDKHWKYNTGDLDERQLWDEYQAAYQIAIERTATPDAPWYVVPADRKWYARIAVQQLIIDALQDMQLSWPRADFDVAAEKARLANS